MRAGISLLVAGGSAASGFLVMRRGYNKELMAAGYDPYRGTKITASAAADSRLRRELDMIPTGGSITSRKLYEYQKYAAEAGDNVNRTALSFFLIFLAVFVSIFVTDLALAIANEKAKGDDPNISLILQKASIKAGVSASLAALAWFGISAVARPVRTATLIGYGALIGVTVIGADSFMENLLLPQTKPK